MQATQLTAAILTALLAGTSLAETAGAQQAIESHGRRITGGETTEIEKHPWQVALQVRGQFYCGGSLIAERWAVTAAHCFKPTQDAGGWRVKTGATNYKRDGDWALIERIVIHPDYRPSAYGHDIALVKLAAKSAGQAIALADAATISPAGQDLEVTGWGATAEDGSGSRVLLKVTVPHVDRTACNAPEAYDGRVTTGMLCAGLPEGGKDACQGDSGGPLVWRRSGGGVEDALLVGVVSWGEGCGRPERPGVYTSVAAYRDWIEEVIAADGP